MRKLLAISAALMLLGTVVFAQTPNVQVVFDEGYTQQTDTCVVGNIEQAYVVARNWNIWMVGIEFAIDYPLGIVWLADNPTADLTIGCTNYTDLNCQGGLSAVWSTPQNAFNPVLVTLIAYRCDACGPDAIISVVPHQESGFVRATDYPGNNFHYGIGLSSVFCPVQIPTENTTWGSVKALYD